MDLNIIKIICFLLFSFILIFLGVWFVQIGMSNDSDEEAAIVEETIGFVRYHVIMLIGEVVIALIGVLLFVIGTLGITILTTAIKDIIF
ncbi:hypothetical protein L6270_03300 [Candidatus Parcubacteria bacterium]|nr:hypothetical protein [Patescibacteria group bacterium]MBU4308991.1 hypothetical protein [Patescibacteria group bacterium]MBU4432218.1 hypothetical protein [Patescibacteria group bacterium]MBU4577351.1 hypothetical protein [Patescibacteria group bacterium]MCG2697039.1 hypothetical protein [Candidatus Parcubacteria bacterium]